MRSWPRAEREDERLTAEMSHRASLFEQQFETRTWGQVPAGEVARFSAPAERPFLRPGCPEKEVRDLALAVLGYGTSSRAGLCDVRYRFTLWHEILGIDETALNDYCERRRRALGIETDWEWDEPTSATDYETWVKKRHAPRFPDVDARVRANQLVKNCRLRKELLAAQRKQDTLRINEIKQAQYERKMAIMAEVAGRTVNRLVRAGVEP